MFTGGLSREATSQEAALVNQLRRGDAVAWRAVEQTFRQRLRSLAACTLPVEIACREDASDIVQQTFSEATQSLDTFRGSSLPELFVWLAAILNHNVSDAVRRHLLASGRSVAAEWRLDDSSHGGARWQGVCAADQTSPSMAAARGEAQEQLQIALERLPARQHRAVRMRHLEGCPLLEIAHELDCTVPAAAAVIARGLRALREALGERDELVE
jgi:RNA polymerase sigma-70 factor (ECF subfamily)